MNTLYLKLAKEKKMKKIKCTIALFVAFLAVTSCANNPESTETIVSESFKVYGNCGMCEKTIEGALVGVEGVQSADWDKESKMMTVAYDKTMLNQMDLKSKISAVGYDTDDTKSTMDTYENLPGCCKYDRPE